MQLIKSQQTERNTDSLILDHRALSSAKRSGRYTPGCQGKGDAPQKPRPWQRGSMADVRSRFSLIENGTFHPDRMTST